MPWRLIQIVVVFAVILLFIVFNLENKCDISFGVTKIHDAPVFLTAFCSFVFGMLCTLPFILSHHLRKKRKAEEAKHGPVDSSDHPGSNHYGID
jgi:uncharacterized integral membrane protein